MGGSTFASPARRMSSAALDSLTAYCTIRLSSRFPSIERMHHVRSKTDHGDLDLVCAVPFEVPIKRQAVGLVGSIDDDGSYTTAAKGVMGSVSREQEAQCSAFAIDIASRLGASEWMVAYYGYPLLALKVPCHLVHLGFLPSRPGSDPPGSFAWYRILTTYSVPYAAIVLALQTLSPAVWLRRDALTLRHSPIAGQPLIDLTLSTDFNRVLDWLGLDLARWEEGFESKEALYKWLADVKPGSVLERGWAEVEAVGLGKMKVDWKRFHTRVDGLPEFIEWLRANWSPSSKTHSVLVVPATVPAVRNIDGARESEHEHCTGRASEDPEQPTPLDLLAASLLDAFDKGAEYTAALHARQEPVRKAIAARRKREDNRKMAEQNRKDKAERLAREARDALQGQQADQGVVVMERPNRDVQDAQGLSQEGEVEEGNQAEGELVQALKAAVCMSSREVLG